MDTLYAFAAFIVIILLEFFAAQYWLPAYYRFGIPVYFRRVDLANPDAVEPKTLEERYQQRVKSPRVHFKAPAQHLIAFREGYLESGNAVNYLPMMHSAIHVDQAQGKAFITGYLNWYVVFTLIYMLLRSLNDSSFIFVAVLVLVIFGLSSVSQLSLNQTVAALLQESLSEPAA